MGNPKSATSKSGVVSSSESSSKSGGRRFSSSSDLWPEVAPEESSRRAAHRKKSLSTSRDQLLYLQALFPYAPYEELMSVITETDGPDEAAQHAYEALNPNYTGYLYLKEQTEVMHRSKSTKAQRAAAFSGLKEALEERATDAFRPGMFSNLSQLQEYHETVGLFAIDTTEWDRAMLLPARDLAEMAFMDLPLREEPSTSSSSSSQGEGDAQTGDQRCRARLLSLAMDGSNARFMNTSFIAPRTSSFDTTLLTPKPTHERRGDKPRDGCKTPIASLDTSAAVHPAHEPEETGVLYLQDSDPECKAPIISWAPEAIRVGPAEALRQQEGALRVFDEATFFNDPLLDRQHSSILLKTPEPKAAPPSQQGPSVHRQLIVEAPETLPPLLAVSPNPTPRGRGESHHEPIESPGNSMQFCSGGEDEIDEDGANEDEEEEEGKERDEVDPGHSTDASADRRYSGDTEVVSVIHVVCDPALLESRRKASVLPLELEQGTEDGGRSAAEHQPDFLASQSDASTQCVPQLSLRETAVETLKSRKRRPLTSSEKVKQRMRTLKPVGNLVFRENAELSPTTNPTHETVLGEDGEHDQQQQQQQQQQRMSQSMRATGNALESTMRTDDEIYTDPSTGTQQVDWATRDSRGNRDVPLGSRSASTVAAAAAAGAAEPSSHAGNARDRVYGQAVSLPAAHSGCSSLDPAAYLNQEEERWSCIVEMLKPFEDVFGAKYRCELVRCIHDDCRAIRTQLTEILRRLLHVAGVALRGKEIAEGFTEEPMDLPLFGSLLLSTSPVRLQELLFREEKCELSFCEEGTRLRVKLNVKKLRLEPIQFAYIDEAEAARQNRAAQQSRRKMLQPRSRAAAWTLRHHAPEKYRDGITRGTATISASNVKLKGIVYVWLMASGKAYVTFQEADVSVGSFKVSTDVAKLNVLFTLGSPVLKLFVERALLQAIKGLHAF